jgi:putative nucleotidyltransferase with HDIG domain
VIDADQIRELFADLLDRISDEALRQQVVEAWVLACREGGWEDLEAVRRMPFTLLTDCGDIGFIEHTVAVTLGALGIAEGQEQAYDSLPYPIDYDRLVAGGLLHDVGKLLEIESDGQGGYRKSHSGRCTRHPISGTAIAARVGMPLEIQNIIACHSREGDGRPKVLETIFIHQADFAAFDPFTLRASGALIE